MTSANHIRLKQVKGIGPKRYQSILAKLKEVGKTVDSLFGMPAGEIVQVFNLPKNVAVAIADSPKIKHQTSLEAQLEATGIKVITKDSKEYPKRLLAVLGDKAPEKLYVWGNLSLLGQPSVGFCGSRNISDKGISVAEDVSKQVTDLEWVVVSGHARGADTAAHRTALENGGSTIIVIPQGILDFKLRRELKKIAKPDRVLVISEFEPEAGWHVGKAMSRNKTIIALSDAMVLIEARDKGGTFDAGKTSLRLKIPLYVARYQDTLESRAGNEYLLKRGAKPLGKKQDTGRANLAPLIDVVTKSHSRIFTTDASKEKSEQLSLLESEVQTKTVIQDTNKVPVPLLPEKSI